MHNTDVTSLVAFSHLLAGDLDGNNVVNSLDYFVILKCQGIWDANEPLVH
jgi:hypothetical protein